MSERRDGLEEDLRGIAAAMNDDHPRSAQILIEAAAALSQDATGERTGYQRGVEDAARVCEGYDWVRNHDIQDPTAHQVAVAKAIRALASASHGDK